mmetsp:Transcript_65492/g.191656  ORF Transcript_65492/g.191656 Transcript_65492/m.191656 type:complete len:559 (-) Transcript_65492:112-1788(-)
MAFGPLAAVALFVGLQVSSVAAQGMMRRDTRQAKGGTSALQAAIERTLQGEAAERLLAVEASIRPTYEAFPKNSMGRIPASEIFSAIVRGYFAKEHGWLINGLEPHGMQANVSEVQEVTILQDRAPGLVEALIEAKRSGRGLSLQDVVAMVAALERLILDDSIALLEASYFFNDLSISDALEVDELHEVLRSYLVAVALGSRLNHSDVRRHRNIKQKLERRKSDTWLAIVEFESDAALNFGYRQRQQVNPFAPAHFTFQDAAGIVEDIARAYGKWQTAECRHMTDQLVALDPDGTGRILLKTFYSQPDTADYQFSESESYLREIGALDETVGGSPRVRIANYMMGPSNCIASNSYYSVCCLSDCEALMNDIEGRIQAPTAPVQSLLSIVGNLSSVYVDGPRELPQDLRQRLEAVAERHGGGVPLHGRLFAQWLHHAFPQECPYPHVHETATVLTPSHWSDANRTISLAKEERQRHINEAQNVTEAPYAEPAALEWSDEEVLPAHEPPQRPAWRLGSVARGAVQLAALVAVAKAAYAGLRAAAGSEDAAKKDDLPSWFV